MKAEEALKLCQGHDTEADVIKQRLQDLIGQRNTIVSGQSEAEKPEPLVEHVPVAETPVPDSSTAAAALTAPAYKVVASVTTEQLQQPAPPVMATAGIPSQLFALQAFNLQALNFQQQQQQAMLGDEMAAQWPAVALEVFETQAWRHFLNSVMPAPIGSFTPNFTGHFCAQQPLVPVAAVAQAPQQLYSIIHPQLQTPYGSDDQAAAVLLTNICTTPNGQQPTLLW